MSLGAVNGNILAHCADHIGPCDFELWTVEAVQGVVQAGVDGCRIMRKINFVNKIRVEFGGNYLNIFIGPSP
jgi:hypothetical protein